MSADSNWNTRRRPQPSSGNNWHTTPASSSTFTQAGWRWDDDDDYLLLVNYRDGLPLTGSLLDRPLTEAHQRLNHLVTTYGSAARALSTVIHRMSMESGIEPTTDDRHAMEIRRVQDNVPTGKDKEEP